MSTYNSWQSRQYCSDHRNCSCTRHSSWTHTWHEGGLHRWRMNKDQRSNELWVHLVDRLRRGLWREEIEMSYQLVESLNQSQPHCGLTKTFISPSLLLTVYPPTCRGYSWYCSRRTGSPGTQCQTRVRTTAVNWERNKVQSGSSPNLVTRPQPSYFWFMHGWGMQMVWE